MSRSQVVMLEIAEVIEVESDENSHNLRTAHSPFTLSMLDAVRLLQSQFCYFNIKFLAKVIRNTKNLCNFVFGNHRYNICNLLIIIYKGTKI